MASELLDKLEAKMRQSWQFRAEALLNGNASQLGAMLIAILGRHPHHPPEFTGLAQIDKQGVIRCNMTDKHGNAFVMIPVCHLDVMVTGFRKLADHLKLNDDDRRAMFAEVQKWIGKDHRAKSDANLF